ncbi:MAG: NADPH:quinone oxidoreductase family protein, partial [Pseudomonadota bacterium]
MTDEMTALTLSREAEDFEGLALTRSAMPTPGPGEVLVRIRASAVNFVDLLMSEGRYQYRPPLPDTLGSDFAGEVVEDSAQFPAGTAVMGMARGGAFATHITVPADALTPKPAAFSFGQAAAFGQPYLTAHVALTRFGRLQAGQWVLVNGASGGVGLAAVDVAKRMGAHVIATSASAAKLRIVADEYAPDAVLNVTESFREDVKRITGGGADLVYDPVGGDVFDESVRCVAFGGKYLVIGFADGRIPTIAANYPLIKGFALAGANTDE